MPTLCFFLNDGISNMKLRTIMLYMATISIHVHAWAASKQCKGTFKLTSFYVAILGLGY